VSNAPDELTEDQARAEICRVGRSLFERGYVHATAGNISFKLRDGSTLITPTDACLGFLQADDLVCVDASGHTRGMQKASKTLALHQRLQAADGDARCIIHTHSTHCVLLSLLVDADPTAFAADEPLPPLTPYFVMKVGHAPLLPYRRPGDPQVADLAQAAIDRYRALGAPIRALLLARLGPIVWHRTPAAAMATLEELEETAKLACQLRSTGVSVQALSGNAIDSLRTTFNARW
jgi:3-dehydro-4-phosphotetronate decarboxylase